MKHIYLRIKKKTGMKTITIVLFISFLTSITNISFTQEKTLKRASEKLDENDFLACKDLLKTVSTKTGEEALLNSYVNFRYLANELNPEFNLDKAYLLICNIESSLVTIKIESNWCKKYNFCVDNVASQKNEIALKALQKLEGNKTDGNYQNFFTVYASSDKLEKAKESFHTWKFEAIKESANKEDFERFIKTYPEAKEIDKAKLLIEEIDYKYCINSKDAVSLKSFIDKYPKSTYLTEIKIKFESIEFENVKISSNIEEFENYLKKYPNSKYTNEVLKKIDELKNGVYVTSTGSGKTSEKAKEQCLRNALEQIYGTFISSNTNILNDQLIYDEIVSIASGNINSYEIINETQMLDGTWNVLAKVLVSIEKITSFVESKGFEVEIKGGLYAQNIKQQRLNEEAEIKSIRNLIAIMHEPLQNQFDFTITTSEPIVDKKKGFEIDLKVKGHYNKNADFCADYITKTLKGISLSEAEVESYLSIGKQVYPLVINWNNKNEVCYLRTAQSRKMIDKILFNWSYYRRSYIVESNIGKYPAILFSTRYNSDSGYKPEGHNPLRYINSQDSKWSKIEFKKLKEFMNHKTIGREVEDETPDIAFLSSGQEALEFIYSVKLTLDELEKLDGFKVENQIQSKYQNGGFIFFEKNGHGIVVEQNIFHESDSLVKIFSSNGYSDWKIATAYEISLILPKLYQFEHRSAISSSSLHCHHQECNFEVGFSFDISDLTDTLFKDIPCFINTNKVNDYKFCGKNVPLGQICFENSRTMDKGQYHLSLDLEYNTQPENIELLKATGRQKFKNYILIREF